MNKIKLLILLFVGGLLCPTFSFAQLQSFQFEQIDSLQNLEKKTVVIFIHTDWCKYCEAMKNTTLKDKKIIERLNKSFYFISFNAEEKRSILFNRKKFTHKPTGNNIGSHQLAEQLATVNNKIAYPTLCFLNADFEIIFQISNYISISNLKKLLESVP
jgi:thioredoxin-related protein